MFAGVCQRALACTICVLVDLIMATVGKLYLWEQECLNRISLGKIHYARSRARIFVAFFFRISYVAFLCQISQYERGFLNEPSIYLAMLHHSQLLYHKDMDM